MAVCRILFVFSFVLLCLGGFSQQKYTLSGTITDASSGEDLIGAVVTIQNTNYSAVSNSYGFYSLSIPEGDYNMNIRQMGYANQFSQVKLHSSQLINFRMNAISYELDDVEVSGERGNRNVTSLEMGNVKINPKQIENIPVLFGERDLIKTMQLMPGVKAAGEGKHGFLCSWWRLGPKPDFT